MNVFSLNVLWNDCEIKLKPFPLYVNFNCPFFSSVVFNICIYCFCCVSKKRCFHYRLPRSIGVMIPSPKLYVCSFQILGRVSECSIALKVLCIILIILFLFTTYYQTVPLRNEMLSLFWVFFSANHIFLHPCFLFSFLTWFLPVQLQIEDLTRKLRTGDLGIPVNPEDRSE